jgi:hypothetical protein
VDNREIEFEWHLVDRRMFELQSELKQMLLHARELREALECSVTLQLLPLHFVVMRSDCEHFIAAVHSHLSEIAHQFHVCVVG